LVPFGPERFSGAHPFYPPFPRASKSQEFFAPIVRLFSVLLHTPLLLVLDFSSNDDLSSFPPPVPPFCCALATKLYNISEKPSPSGAKCSTKNVYSLLVGHPIFTQRVLLHFFRFSTPTVLSFRLSCVSLPFLLENPLPLSVKDIAGRASSFFFFCFFFFFFYSQFVFCNMVPPPF